MCGLSDIAKTTSCPAGEYPREFCEFVVEWGWPSELSRSQTEQVRNLCSVLWRMYQHGRPYNDVDTYSEARDWRASQARLEDRTRKEKYYKTVHSQCVRRTGFSGKNAMHAFLRKARRLIVAYDDEHARSED
jgi:hypothetical protein